jgi:dienelactone hydrolase
MTNIHFTSHGFSLAGNLFQAAKPRNIAFLLIQGWTGHQNILLAQKLAAVGFTTLTYDMRGNRESEGNIADFSRADFIADALQAYDYLRQQVGEDVKIGVVGSSFGSYTAVLLAAERDVHCLSLRVPASYPDEGFNDPQLNQSDTPELTAWRHKPLDYTQNRAFAALHNFTGLVQVIEAEKDELVPRQAPQNYATAVPDKSQLHYVVMKGAPHRLDTPELQAEYERIMLDWVATVG